VEVHFDAPLIVGRIETLYKELVVRGGRHA
jgi:hypothetical protein